MRRFILSFLAVCLILGAGTAALNAQPLKRPGGPTHRPGGPDGVELPSPETSVRNTLDRLKPVLNLTEKQYDKLYRLFLKEARMKEQMLRPVPPGPGAGFGPDFGGDDAPFPREHMGKPGVPPHGGPGMRPPHENGPADGGGPVGGNGPAGRWTDSAQAEKCIRRWTGRSGKSCPTSSIFSGTKKKTNQCMNLCLSLKRNTGTVLGLLLSEPECGRLYFDTEKPPLSGDAGRGCL